MGRRWAVIGGLVAAICTAVAVGTGGDSSRPAHKILASHMDGTRWFQGRSTLPLPWGAWAEDVPLVDKERLFSDLLVEAEERDPAAMALFLIWRREPGDLARARRELQALGPSASRWNEEALVLLASGETFEGFEAVQKGLALEPARLELLFTRSVILEEMQLLHQARAAWNTYLEHDPEGPWADEARQRLEQLGLKPDDRPLLESLRFGLRMDLLKASSASDLAAILSAPGTGGYLEELEQWGETILRKEIDYLTSLDELGWQQRREALAESNRIQASVLAGRVTWRDLEARAPADDPLLAVRHAHLAVYDALQRSEADGAIRLLDELRSLCFRLGCKEEAILAASDYGTLLNQIGDHQGAEEAWAQAAAELPPYLRLRRAELLNKRAPLARALEAPDEADQMQREALRLVAGSHDQPNIAQHQGHIAAVAILGLGTGARDRGMFEVSLAHAREALEIARSLAAAKLSQRAAANLANGLMAIGRYEEAALLLEEELALARGTEIPVSSATLETTLGQVRLKQGQVDRALEGVNRAVETIRQVETPRSLIWQLSDRSEILEAMGDLEGAVRDLQEALALADELDDSSLAPLARVRAEARYRALRTNAARLGLVSEPKLDPWQLLGGRPARALDDDECLLAAVPFEKATVLFVRHGGNDSLITAGEGLPVFNADTCPDSTRRVVVLETPITIAGLLSPRVRMIRPDLAVVVSRDPSLPWPRQTFKGRALAVHSPGPIAEDRAYPRLPGAPEEARFLLGAFPGSSELRGTAATPAGVRTAANAWDLLHFGVHGEARTGAGAASYLLLGGPSGRLQVVDILGLELSRRRPVVVLSACKGGGNSGDRERDGAGLPWAFLEAGAQIVIATQDSLDDRAAVVFSAGFYAALAAGEEVSIAFEQALVSVREKWSHEVAAAFTIYI